MIALNPDLIERVETTPDTVVTMVDEKKFLIAESVEDVLRLITDYRAYVIARSRDISVADYDPSGRAHLSMVPTELVANVTDEIEIDSEIGSLSALSAIDDGEYA